MATIDAETGLKAAFISADDLITAKVASARAQDLADVEALRKARNFGATGTKSKRRDRTRKPLLKPSG